MISTSETEGVGGRVLVPIDNCVYTVDLQNQPYLRLTVTAASAILVHHARGRHPGLFTTSYFHTPDELVAEVAEAGFIDLELVAVEGPWKCIPDFDQKWQDEEFRSFLVEIIEHMEGDATVIGFGGHMMIVATKPVGWPQLDELPIDFDS